MGNEHGGPFLEKFEREALETQAANKAEAEVAAKVYAPVEEVAAPAEAVKVEKAEKAPAEAKKGKKASK